MSTSACPREVTLKAPARIARAARLSADMGHGIERPGTRRNGRRGRRSGGRKRAKCGGPVPGAFELPGRVAVEMDVVPLGHVRVIRELHYVPDLIAGHAPSADTAHGADAGTAHGPVSTSRRQLSATDRLTGSFSEKGFIKHVGISRGPGGCRLNARCHKARRQFASTKVPDGRRTDYTASRHLAHEE